VVIVIVDVVVLVINFLFSIDATSVISVFIQINSIPMLNGMNCKVKEPIPTLDNLQEVKINKWERFYRMCLMIMKRLILEAFKVLFLRVKVQADFLKRLNNYLPKMKRQR
ncbi:hypothetical protein CR513_04832, partial [Mucuna pruriens]